MPPKTLSIINDDDDDDDDDDVDDDDELSSKRFTKLAHFHLQFIVIKFCASAHASQVGVRPLPKSGPICVAAPTCAAEMRR